MHQRADQLVPEHNAELLQTHETTHEAETKNQKICPEGAVKSPNCLSGPGLPTHQGQEPQPFEASVVPILARII